jgi:3-oxoacyl-[acyl-carrier-protein] synthase III
MRARIVGLGQWLPTEVRDNSAWPVEFAQRGRSSSHRELVDIDPGQSSPEDQIALRYFASEAQDPFLGTTRRRVAAPDMTAPEAEALAGAQALEQAGIRADELDVIISWAAVPERIVPASATKVAHILGASRAYAFGMDAACATPIAQLEVASALIEAGRAKRVLLTQSHLITRAFPMMHPASPNVGDAATAMLVCGADEPSLLASFARTHGEYYSAVTWCRGSENDAPWWEAGPAFYLGSQDRAAAGRLVRSTVRIAAETIRDLLSLARIAAGDVEVLVSIQPRRWIPQAIAEALGVSILAPQTFDELSHLGGCGVLTNLIHAKNIGFLKPGTRIVLYAQGAGFTRAAALIRW